MDNSGNNRYELLFMDDDDSSGLEQPQIAAVVAAPKKPEPAKAPKVPKSKSEKENKPVVAGRKANTPVAKNASPVKGGKGPAGGDVGRPKNPTANGANNQGRFNNNQRYGNKESIGEFGNELPQRQFNNRDNRGPPRVRSGEKFGKREFDRLGSHQYGFRKGKSSDLQSINRLSTFIYNIYYLYNIYKIIK